MSYRIVRFQQPTSVQLSCGKRVQALSVLMVQHLFGYMGPEEFAIGAVTPDLRRVYMDF